MIDVETLAIPTDGSGYVRPYIMGGLDRDWQVGWGYEGFTKPVAFYKAVDSADAVAVKRAIDARIDSLYDEQAELERIQAEEEAKQANEAKEKP
jgi:hypothetical protein